MHAVIDILKALADDNRARIVLALQGRALCVCQIVELVQLPTSTVSEHLLILKQAGIVSAEKEGRWVYYRLASSRTGSAAHDATSLLTRLFEGNVEAKRDAERLACILRIDPEELCKRQKAGTAKCCGGNDEKGLLL
ncbi:MAG: ArsR/SmtB family transcription factor [Pirellulaceae bacterium]